MKGLWVLGSGASVRSIPPWARSCGCIGRRVSVGLSIILSSRQNPTACSDAERVRHDQYQAVVGCSLAQPTEVHCVTGREVRKSLYAYAMRKHIRLTYLRERDWDPGLLVVSAVGLSETDS
jgi:uncharacterized protein YdbL (DUF1318 family)